MEPSRRDEIDHWADSQVAAGAHASKEQALAWLRAEVQKGVDDLDAGRTVGVTEQLIAEVRHEGWKSVSQRLREARREHA